MNLKENRKLAFVVLAVVIVFSICVQGSVALLNRRGDTEVLFMEGELHEMMVRCADQGALDIVSREADSPKSYTAGAVKFNKQIKGFPANLISGLLGVDPLTVYGG